MIIQCAWCSRVKTGETWVELRGEMFAQEIHAGRVSHGICPTCAAVYFPEATVKPALNIEFPLLDDARYLSSTRARTLTAEEIWKAVG